MPNSGSVPLQSVAMGNSFVCALILAGFLSIGMCTNSSCFQGTRAVTWTLYPDKGRITWNDASRFCKERGGYLPVTNTDITMQAFIDMSSHNRESFWLGLYSTVPGTVPNVWEADCCLRQANFQYWAPGVGEPDSLDNQRCCRYSIDNGGWRTAPCNKYRDVVCEMDRGNCTYATLNGVTITTLPNATNDYVNDVSTCWSLCLELRHNGEECVAAVLEEETALCKLYVGKRLLDENDIETSASSDSVLMLRRCFQSNVSNEVFYGLNTDARLQPVPWSVSCLAEHNESLAATDFLPTGVTMTTSLPSSTDAAGPGTTTTAAVSASTTPSSSTQLTSSAQSPEPTVSTATEDITASGPKPPPCRCLCSNKSISTPAHPVNLTVIPLNKTSNYRRAKTSVWTGQTSHTIVGTPWVVACVCVFVCVVLCDLNPHKWRPDTKRRGTRKTKVAPGP